MKRALLGVLVLAVCGMMVVPLTVMGGPSKGGAAGKSSTQTDEFVAGPTSGDWGGILHAWDALKGGSITLWNVPDEISYEVQTGTHDGVSMEYITWDTHREHFLMFKERLDRNGRQSWHYLAPKDLTVGKTYECPSEDITGLSFYNQLENWGSDGKVLLTAGLWTDLHPLPEGKKVYIEVTKTQLIVSGTDIPFNYYDWYKESIEGDPTTYGSSNHDFKITIDK